MKRDYCYYLRKKYQFLFDDHARTITKQLRYIRNAKRKHTFMGVIKTKQYHNRCLQFN
jgi:hypothetical protein